MPPRMLPISRIPTPGEILGIELAARGWTQKKFAARIRRPPQVVSGIVRGVKRVTPATARNFAQALKIPAGVWLRLEADYRLHLAEIESRKKRIPVTRRKGSDRSGEGE